MGTGFAKKKKQAKKLQEQFAKMQEDMKNTSVEGSAGNGLVSLKLNGEGEMTELKIQSDCVDPDDIEGLTDLIMAAHNSATSQLREQQSGQGMPDLGQLGF